MQLKVDQAELRAGLMALRGVPPDRPLIPVYGHVLLRAEGAQLVLGAANEALMVRRLCACRAAEAGAVTVPYRRFSDVVASLPPGELTLTQDGGRLYLRGGRSRSVFDTLPGEEFPTLGEHWPIFDADGRSLQLALGRVVVAASSDEATHPQLCGVYMVLDPLRGYLAATDGLRLARAVFSVQGKRPWAGIIPTEAARLVEKLVLPENHLLQIGTLAQGPEAGVVFATADTTVVSRLRAGRYPADVAEQALLARCHLRVEVDHQELVQAVSRALIFARDNGGYLELHFATDQAVVLGDLGSTGNRSEFPAQAATAWSVGVNGNYLLEALRTLYTDRVVLAQVGPRSPLILREVEGDLEYRHAVMPMTLRSQTQPEAPDSSTVD